jgi:hypothetical protein
MGTSRLAVGFDLRPDIGQSLPGLVLEIIEKRQAAGTCRLGILANFAWARETGSYPGGYSGRKQCAGAWTSGPKIGPARHEQRDKSYPEYGPENHESVISFVDAGSMAARFCVLLKSFVKFETNSSCIPPSPGWRQCAMSNFAPLFAKGVA